MTAGHVFNVVTQHHRDDMPAPRNFRSEILAKELAHVKGDVEHKERLIMWSYKKEITPHVDAGSRRCRRANCCVYIYLNRGERKRVPCKIFARA